MKEQTKHQPERRSFPKAACALSCLMAMALLSLPTALTAAADAKPDSPESVTALKKLGAELELNEQGTVDSVSFAASSNFTEDALAHLSGLKSMTHLNLDGLPVTDLGLKHLEKLPQLTWLRLSDTGVTDKGLVHLKNLANLRLLSLTSTEVTDKGIGSSQGFEEASNADASQELDHRRRAEAREPFAQAQVIETQRHRGERRGSRSPGEYQDAGNAHVETDGDFGSGSGAPQKSAAGL